MSDDTERRPASVYGHGNEPDPRFSLANERTFLAWVRTCLGIIAGAVALHSLRVPETVWVRKVMVVALLLCAGSISVGASIRWARTERAMRLGLPLPGFSFTGWIAAGICLAAVALAVAFVIV
jgi:putative membrane protein